VPHEPFSYISVSWLPDAKRFVFLGNEEGHGLRIHVQDIDGGAPRAISPEGIAATEFVVSPDGKQVAAVGADKRGYFYSVAGGDRKPIPGFTPGDTPVGWSSDGRYLYTYFVGELPAKVQRLEFATGDKQLWKQLMPSDTAGITDIGLILITPDAKAYVYEYGRTLSDLYLEDGLK
jgi:hypothetical protein